MNSVIEIPLRDVNELPAISRLLIDFSGGSKHFLFYGPMGAGKTTFIKEVCSVLGSDDNFSSPTYPIVNEYQYQAGKIFHFDLYRLKNTDELMDLGIEDYLSSGNYCFFEWPEMAQPMVDKNHVTVEIEVEGNNRYIRISKS